MAKSGAELRNAYAAKAYDDIRLQVKKGDKERIRAHAEQKGMKLQTYIKSLIYEDMEK